MTNETQGPIAITCGEPSGIGPEIASKAWQKLKTTHPILWMGDPSHLPQDIPYKVVEHAKDSIKYGHAALPVLPIKFKGTRVLGSPNPEHAQSIVNVIETAVELTQSGQTRAICTAPIHKAALIRGANFPYPGHTELLAALCNVDKAVMMLACDALKTVPATIHIPLSEVKNHLTHNLLEYTIRTTYNEMIKRFKVSNPRIVIAGLNPHAGEDGEMGLEEKELITPVLDKLRQDGLPLIGPESADTLFHEDARKHYDVAICMYHDQALIPVKTLDFSSGVNVTLGLPFVRTSPDHGTALNIAHTQTADPSSMIAAIKLAHKMSAL